MNVSHSHPALATAEELIAEARNGRMFILIDDEDRENEGDLVMPAQMVTPDAINFMARHGRGLICLALTKARTESLGLPMMTSDNGGRHQTAFTVSIEARDGVSTGISAADRAHTINVAIDPTQGREHLVSPGHVFPLVAREGGVLVRSGHTEAAVDLARLAGLLPAGVICEIMNEDGTMARLPDLVAFAQLHALKIGTIADLISYRRRHDTLIECMQEQAFESEFGGVWRARIYRNKAEDREHFALVKGDIDPSEPVMVRMHALSFFDDGLARINPRRRNLHAAMAEIGRVGRGVVVILGSYRASLAEKLQGGPDDHAEDGGVVREYGIGAQILADLGVSDMILLTNSQRHTLVGLEGYGLKVVEERRIPALPN